MNYLGYSRILDFSVLSTRYVANAGPISRHFLRIDVSFEKKIFFMNYMSRFTVVTR